MKMEELVNLSYEEKIYGYVEQDGSYEEYMFQKTPENIANFVGSRPMADSITLTDPLDRLILNTFGNFINQCPDKQLLEDVKQHLLPIQYGEVEPKPFFCPTMEEVEEYYMQQEAAGGDMDLPHFSPALPISIWRKCEKQKISHLS